MLPFEKNDNGIPDSILKLYKSKILFLSLLYLESSFFIFSNASSVSLAKIGFIISWSGNSLNNFLKHNLEKKS